jgi:hypothetical protein
VGKHIESDGDLRKALLAHFKSVAMIGHERALIGLTDVIFIGSI